MEKPIFDMSHQDGNTMFILGGARKILREAGQEERIEEMSNRVLESESYQEALQIIGEYVEYRFGD